MKRFSHISWYEWVLYVLMLLIAFHCLHEGFRLFSAHSEYQSPLLPLYVPRFLAIIHLCELLAGLCGCAGIFLMIFRKRLGWFLALYGSIIMAFIVFEPFFEFGLDAVLLFWILIPVAFGCVLLLGPSRSLYAIRPPGLILMLVAGILTGCLYYKAFPVCVYLSSAFD